MKNFPNGAAAGAVRVWLRAEALAVLALSVILYGYTGSGWWLLASLLLTPDLSMLPYLIGTEAGAVSYNLFHSHSLPLGLAAAAIGFSQAGALPYLLIWTAHIGMDRFFGYGLKYPAAFASTHLGTVGKSRMTS